MDPDLIEEIEISGDQGELDTIRGDVAVLNRYYDEISAQGGISRDQAQLLVRDCGVQLSPDYPINSFTEVPSRTNYAVAMEGLFGTMFNRVWELIKKAAALLMKVVRWVIDAIRLRLGKKQDSGKAVAASVQVLKVNAKFADRVPEQAQKTPQVEEAERLLAAAEAQYISNFNDLLADLLTDNVMGTAIRNTAIELFAFHDVLERKLELFEDLVRSPLNGGDELAQNQLKKQLETIATPIEGRRIQSFLATAHVSGGGSTMIEAVSALRNAQREMRTSQQATPIHPADAADMLSDEGVEELFNAPFVVHMDGWLRSMDKLNHKLGTLAAMHPSAPVNQELVKAYADAFDVVDREIRAQYEFFAAAESCRTARDQFSHDLFEAVSALIRLSRAKIDAAQDHSASAEMKRELDHIAQQYRAA